jgi:N-acetylglucosamine transport system permease protein
MQQAGKSDGTMIVSTPMVPPHRSLSAAEWVRKVVNKVPGWAAHLFLLVWCVTVIFPMVWLLLGSLKSSAEIYMNPWGLPRGWFFENYGAAWTGMKVGTYFLNSVLYIGISIPIALLLNAMAAYTLARYEFRGNRLIFFVFVAGLLFPAFLGLIPWYFLMQSLHLMGTRIGLIIAWVVGTFPFGIFVLTGFFRTLPYELEDAAVIDGCSLYGVFFRIYLPLARPGLITVGLFQFLGFWNDFLTPLLVLGPDSNARPLATGLQGLISSGGGAQITVIHYGTVFAALVIMLVPCLILYMIFQPQLMQGINAGALKG